MPYGNLLVESSIASIVSHKISNHVDPLNRHTYHEACFFKPTKKGTRGVKKRHAVPAMTLASCGWGELSMHSDRFFWRIFARCEVYSDKT
jgi:hypothetical protein